MIYVLGYLEACSVYLKLRFCENDTKFLRNHLDLSFVVTVKSTVEISQNLVALSEYMNFNDLLIRSRITIFFFNKFAACFDLVKLDKKYLRIKIGIQKKRQNNNLFL